MQNAKWKMQNAGTFEFNQIAGKRQA
jgi:hypothetical protein